MKVLLYSRVFWPMVGGVETYTRLLASGLAAAKNEGERIELTILTTADGPAELSAGGAKIMRRPSWFKSWGFIRKTDVVMLAGPLFVPLALGLLARRPVVIEHHGYQACCPNGVLLYDPDRSVCPERFLRGQLRSCVRCNRKAKGLLGSIIAVVSTVFRRFLCRFAARNICVSSHVEKRVALPRTRVIYHGLQDEPVNGQPQMNIASRPLVFAYVGRITGEKGLPLLLRAASELKREGRQFEVRIVGDGTGRLELEVLAEQLNLSDRFSITGFLQGKSFADQLAEIDVVVMPSICEETAGLSAMEQMKRGRAVIVADIGGLGEVVGTGGLKFTPGSMSELAGRMREVLDDPGIANRVGALGRDRATALFGLDRMIREHIEVFEQVTSA